MKKVERLNTKVKKKCRALFVCIIFVLLLLFWNIVRSYTSLELETCFVASDKLYSEIKLVLISDLHDHEFGERNLELVNMIAQEEPDLILMAGDFINDDSEDEDIVLSLVKELGKIAPIYFSMGNHELDYESRTGVDLAEKITDAGATVLELAYEDIEINGESIRIGGMYEYAFAMDGDNSTKPENMDSDVYQFLKEFQNTENFKLMMAHRPDSFIFGEASKTWDIDLVVSGHAHGGQVVMPFLGGLWAPDQGWFPEYVHGLHEKDKLNIFITSGLGGQPEAAPRFNNPPEVAVITLAPEE